MKKLFIFGVIVLVSWLSITYFILNREEKGRQLVTDAYYGDLLAVKSDVEEGAPLDFEFYFQDDKRQYNGIWFNALHAAASGGNEDIINFLLEQGFNINTQTPNGWTPLFIAARDGQAEAAKLLIFRGANLNVQTDQGATPLLMVLTQPFENEKARTDLLWYLLRRGADANLPDFNGFPPIYYAVLSQKPELVEALLEYDAIPPRPMLEQLFSFLEKQSALPAKKITALLKKRLSEK